ncbi:MAG: aspartate carbamoyltransferase catalytic subunit [Acidobacteria bacterium]|nr:MAG: aspartate carbamoyltransferase catalytic subunit [Acidobacteriota bacterium]REK04576.1 MAG: aspartate carbamoyltransferase catalytic subunit [Acidobacteriota bacterium]
MAKSGWQRKDLLGIAELERTEIEAVLATAASFHEVATRPIKKVPTLRGKTVLNLFFEPSTRTRSSFEIAEKRMSADAINFSTAGSSLSKGESLLDTTRNLQAMSPDVLVIRHAHPRVPHQLAARLDTSVVNAGDGAHEHPTQALLDAFTILQHREQLDGLRVAILGDIEHSRVVRSNVLLLRKMGASVVIGGPYTMMPRSAEALGVDVAYSIDEALEGADVVMMLRVQTERQSRMSIPSADEYFALFGLDRARLRRANEGALVLHPGPINRGVEIASDVADGRASLILEQVSSGVAVRMAVLYLLAGGAS